MPPFYVERKKTIVVNKKKKKRKITIEMNITVTVPTLKLWSHIVLATTALKKNYIHEMEKLAHQIK